MNSKYEREASRHGSKLEGRYANYFKVGHSAFEFVLDFGQFYQDNGGAQFHTRIITSPAYGKALFELLRDSIAQYEQTFEPIRGAEETSSD